MEAGGRHRVQYHTVLVCARAATCAETAFAQTCAETALFETPCVAGAMPIVETMSGLGGVEK